jgi:hypothetical protein
LQPTLRAAASMHDEANMFRNCSICLIHFSLQKYKLILIQATFPHQFLHYPHHHHHPHKKTAAMPPTAAVFLSLTVNR